MDFMLWLGLVVVVIISAAALAVTTNVWEEKTFCDDMTWRAKTGSEIWRHRFARIGFCIFAATLVGSPIYYELPDYSSRIFSVESDGLTEHRWGTFRWGKDVVVFQEASKRFGNIRPGVSAITANPKVRHVSYEIQGRIVDPWLYLKNIERKNQTHIRPDEEIRAVLQFWAYEFNNAHSKELAEFYNPSDPKQVESLRQLVEPYFNTATEKFGVRTELVGFSID